MKKFLEILLSFSMLISIAGCSEDKVNYEYMNTMFSGPFDTVIYFNAYVESQDEFDKYVSILKENFTVLDQYFDKYTSYEGVNNIKTINDNAGIEPVEVNPIIIDLIDTWMNDYNQISSKVNIALGPVLELWHNARESAVTNEDGQPEGVPPTYDELQEASQWCDTDYIVVDDDANTIYLTDEHASLDVGAIAKGYAVEYVKDLLIQEGAKSFLISAGGNVASYGKRLASSDGSEYLSRSKSEFCVGIQSPETGAYENTGSIVAMVIPEDNSIVTSGDYERYFVDAQGNWYSHLIDSSTLYPAQNFRSVTIITEDSAYADFLSTSLFLMDEETGFDFVESHDGMEAIWLMNDGTMIHTSGLVEGDNFYSLI